MNVILLGPQGSGKGTLAELIAKNFNLYHLEIGELLREAAKTDHEIDEIVNKKGGLVPDETALLVVTRKVNQERPSRDGILFDGYPRSVEQYLLLKDWLGQVAKKVDKAILIKISHEESIRRLSGRRYCRKCDRIWNLVAFPKPPSQTTCICGGELYQREDDKPEVIKERLLLYEKITGPLIEMLDSEGKLIEVGGERPIDVIYEEIAKLLNK